MLFVPNSAALQSRFNWLSRNSASELWTELKLCVWFIQICSQLSERLEKQQTANRGELEKIRVILHTHTAVCTQTHAADQQQALQVECNYRAVSDKCMDVDVTRVFFLLIFVAHAEECLRHYDTDTNWT